MLSETLNFVRVAELMYIIALQEEGEELRCIHQGFQDGSVFDEELQKRVTGPHG